MRHYLFIFMASTFLLISAILFVCVFIPLTLTRLAIRFIELVFGGIVMVFDWMIDSIVSIYMLLEELIF
jgi:hypothetical protein